MTEHGSVPLTVGDFVSAYLDRVGRLLASLDPAPIATLIELLLDTRQRGGTVYLCGNGGSSATAQHFANDLLITVRTRHRPFRAVCLSDNVAVLTAIANDYGYEHVFSAQLEGRVGPSDLLITISASGQSPNVLAAVRTAAAAKCRSVGIVGFDGGALRSLVDVAVHVPSDHGEYGPVEDIHTVVKHVVASYLTHRLRDAADPRGEAADEPA
jgi:D-sedoheptulose 7-phosphate isomerase